jgi:hypothetical protein
METNYKVQYSVNPILNDKLFLKRSFKKSKKC